MIVFDFLDRARDCLQRLSWIRWALKVIAHSHLVLRRIRGEPLMLGVLAAQKVRIVDSVLVGGMAAIGKNVGTLGEKELVDP